MKKKLLAIAVAGAFAAPTVAMAEWSLSGSVSSGISVTVSTVTLGSGSAGTLSMSGSGDLGNGVTGSASFTVAPHGGGSVGLAGDFGSVTLSDSGVAWSGSGMLGVNPSISTDGKTASFGISHSANVAGLTVGAGYNTGTNKVTASASGNAGDVSIGLAYNGSSTTATLGLLGLSVTSAGAVSWSSDLGGGMGFSAAYADSTITGTLKYSF